MALVAKPDLFSDLGEGRIGPANQSFRVLEPTLHDITLRTNADRLLEGAAEMIGAETGHTGEICQGQPVIQMRLDVIADALQSFA
jgi:hypothetical protein